MRASSSSLFFHSQNFLNDITREETISWMSWKPSWLSLKVWKFGALILIWHMYNTENTLVTFWLPPLHDHMPNSHVPWTYHIICILLACLLYNISHRQLYEGRDFICIIVTLIPPSYDGGFTDSVYLQFSMTRTECWYKNKITL